jgi:hypothetical protein
MTFLVDNNLKATKVAANSDPATLGLADAQYLAKSGQTITLPVITATMVGRSFLVKLGEAHSSDVTVSRGGTDTIEGNESYKITSDYGFVELIASTGKWLVVKESKEVANDEALRINKRTETTDPSILINADRTGAGQEADAVAIAVQRGTTGTDAKIKWNETLDRWEIASHGLYVQGNTSVGGTLEVTGNLTVNGTTTTVNSTTTTVDDPIFTLGGDTAPASDDNKDRGIEFRWHNGSAAKVGFFGYDDSASVFTFIPDATNSSEVFSGTAGNALFGQVDCTYLVASTGVYSNSLQSSAGQPLNLTGANGSVTISGSMTFSSGTLTIPTSSTATTPTLTANSTLVATTEFVQKAALGVSNKTSNYTLALTDAGSLIEFDSASNLTLTIPANASVAFPIGSQIVIARLGSGKVNIAITSDTLYSVSSNKYISNQYGAVTLVKRTSTTWYLFGDLSAS